MADEEAPQLKKDVVPSDYRDRYKASGGTNGDFIGVALQGVAKDGEAALQAVNKENNIPVKKWSAHNIGMQRMNLANVLRSRFLNGEDVYILGKQYNIVHMRDDYNGTVENNAKSVAKFLETINVNSTERNIKAATKTFWPPERKATVSAEERAAIKAQKDADKALAKKQKQDDAAKAKADKAAAAKAEKDRKAAEKQKAKDDKAAAAKAAKDAKAAAKPAKAEKVKEPA